MFYFHVKYNTYRICHINEGYSYKYQKYVLLLRTYTYTKMVIESFYTNIWKFEQWEYLLEQLSLERLLFFLILLPVFLQYII